MRVVDAAGDPTGFGLAAAVETAADHPVADAVAAHADPTGEPTDFSSHPGRGVSAAVDGRRVHVGRPTLFEGEFAVPEALARRAEAARDAGRVPTFVGWDGRVRSLLVVGDDPREDWRETVSALAAAAERVVVLTGDARAAAEPFAAHPDVDEVFADVPPSAKAEVVGRLRAEGTVAMVGDGSNDAPGLARADLGIAMAGGTELAVDAADAVVTGPFGTVPLVFDLTRAVRRRVRENLGWAFCYNLVAIPAAALGVLNPLVAAVAMAASSLLVVGNSVRPLDLPPEGTDGVATSPEGAAVSTRESTPSTEGAATSTDGAETPSAEATRRGAPDPPRERVDGDRPTSHGGGSP
jgi:Cu2+-exporting ATPase